jgi:hypothetical protein
MGFEQYHEPIVLLMPIHALTRYRQRPIGGYRASKLRTFAAPDYVIT